MEGPFKDPRVGYEEHRNRILLWGMVGVICLIMKPSPLAVIAVILAGGIVVGCLCGLFIWSGRGGWVDGIRLAAFLLLILVISSGDLLTAAMQYLAAGSFFSVGISIGTLLFAWKFMRGPADEFSQVNHSIRNVLDYGQMAKPAWEDDRNAFLAALPEPLRTTMASAFVTVTAFEPQVSSTAPEAIRSSIGGDPLLPPDTEWPAHDGRHLDFLAQINLEEVGAWAPAGAPGGGLLSFFYDPKQPWGSEPGDLGSGRILFSPDLSDLASVPHPSGKTTGRQALEFRRHVTDYLPDSLSEPYYEYYRSLTPAKKEVMSELFENAMETEYSNNRLFSLPYLVQDEMTSELRTAAAVYQLPVDTLWTMVLQLGTCPKQRWQWGDGGCISFWIPTDDISAGRFDRSWVVLQSH